MTEQKQSHRGWTSGLALLLTFVLVLGGATRLLAQGSATPIIVTTVVTPPFDPSLSVWERNPSRMVITLQNTDPTRSYTVRIGGSLKSDDGRVVVTIDNAYAASPITLAPGASRLLNARESGLYDEASVIVTGADRDVIARTGRLPEARYRACLQALDFTSLEPLSAPDPSGCAEFSIQNPEVPRLSYPFCGATIDAVPIQLLAFTWTQPVVQGVFLEYELMIVPVPEGRSPEQAILSTTSPLFFHRRNISANTYVYGPSDPDLQVGQRYAWRVRAQARNGSLTFPNDGWSEVCVFTWGREVNGDDGEDTTDSDRGEDASDTGPTGCFSIAAVTPPDGGTWTQDQRPLFSVALDPAIDSTRITGGLLEVWGDPEEAGSSSPDQDWGVTGANFLRRQTGAMRSGAPVYDLDIVNAPASLREWVAENGSTYAWRVTLEFDGNGETIRRDGVSCTKEQVVSEIFSFSVSTQATAVSDSTCVILTPETPVHNSTVTSPSPVFSVRSLPPLDVNGVEWVEIRIWNYLPSDRNPGDASSRSPDFVRRIIVQGDADKISSTFRTGDLSSILVLPNVRETSKSGDAGFYPAVDSSYVWQVAVHRRSSESIRLDGGECIGAPETILSTLGLFHRDTTRAPDEGPCPDSCSSPPPTNRSLHDLDFAVGDSVTVGRFSMTLTELTSGTPGALTGRGRIRVPWLRVAVDVEFSNVQVNTADQVFTGVVRARQEPSSSPVPSALRNGSGGDLAQDAITEGLNLATSAARMINALRSNDAVAMPIGFQSGILDDAESSSGPGVTIGITDMEFTPAGASMTALAKVPLPFLGRDKGLGFGVRNLCFTPVSFTNGVERTLFLAADVGYEDEGSWGFSVLSPNREGGRMIDSGTYITWDCRGVAAFRVAAAVEFPRSTLVPINEEGDVDPDITKLVTARAAFQWHRSGHELPSDTSVATGEMTASGFHVLATGTIDRFAPTNAPDLSVDVGSIAFDWSDFENPEGINFPTGYTGEQSSTWRGFYMRGASVALPRAIARSGKPGEPVTIGAEYLMIDNAGLSFSAYAANLLSLREGRAAGWGFSLDTARLILTNNTPRELSLIGDVNVPIFGEGGVHYTGTLQYSKTESATTTPSFYLTLAAETGLDLPMWSARVDINGNVTVSLVKRKTAGWVAGLELNAAMNFTSAGGGGAAESAPAMSIAGISVKGLRVESVKPYLVSTGDWYLGGQKVSGVGDGGSLTPAEEPTTGGGPSVAGFPLSISDISPSTSESGGKDLVGLAFNINVNLLPSSGAALSGSTTLGLFGKIEPGGAFGQTFVYSHFEIRRILLDASFGNVATVNGGVEFYRNDPVYGNGFYGTVTANILKKIETRVAAQFGSTNQHRYGFIDFSTLFKTGIPLGSTGVSFYGGGGGIWIGMSRSGGDPVLPISSTSDPDGFEIGRALSGYRYAPDKNTKFGARIMLTLGTNRPEMFNADVALEITVNNDWGINNVTLEGEGYGLMKNFPEGREDAKLRARGTMTYLPPKEEFHGVFGATLNQLDVLVLEGDLTIHASSDKWYMKLGTPTAPVTASLEPLGEVGGVYFMLGMIGDEPRPAPPFTIGAGEPTERSLAVKTGDGLVLGAQGAFSTGKQRFLIFTGEAGAAFGFEVSVLHMPGQTCEGAESGLGINGWYGNMSLWAHGNVSIDIDLGDLGSFNLAGVSLSAWLDAGAPNPTWLDGGVQGEYSVMGGLVEGDFDWRFSIGTRCEVPEASLEDVEIITDISPENNARNVSVMAAPTTVFSMNVKDEFPLTLSGVNRTCRMHIDEFSVKSSKGSEVGSGYFLNGGTRWQFMPDNLMLGETEYDVLVRVVLQYKVGDDWVDYIDANGRKVSQERSASFRTGKRPDVIPQQNIAYTWPLQNQRFFMRDDGPVDRVEGENKLVGKVLLRQAQTYLFASPKGSTRRAYVTLMKEGGGANDQIVCQANLSGIDNRAILFYFRPGDLDLNSGYSVRLYTQDSLHGGGSATVSERSKVLYGGNEPFFTELEAQMLENFIQNDGGQMSPGERATLIAILAEDKSRRETHVSARTTDRSLEGVEERAGYLTEPKVLAAYRFGTSRYGRIAQKLAESRLSSTSAPYTFVLRNGSEAYEDIEVNGYKPPSSDKVIATYFTVNRRIEFSGIQEVSSTWRPMYTSNVAALRQYWNKFFNGSYWPMPGPGSVLGGKLDYIALKGEFNRHHWLANDLYTQYYSVSCSGGGVVVNLRYKARAKSDYDLLVRLQRLYDRYKVMQVGYWPLQMTVYMYQLGPSTPPAISNWYTFPAGTYSFDFIPIVGQSVYQARVRHNVYIP